jgi:ATP synthase protein I
VFFGISIVAVGRAARVSPMAMMVTALGSFVLKIIAFMIVLIAIGKSTAFNGRMLGFTALACILAWSAAQAVTAMRMQTLYVEPDGKS